MVFNYRFCISIFILMKTCLVIIFQLAVALNSFSQDKEYNFINYTQENGLPSNESYFVYRDSKDFLWIATDKGVVRYDGNKMESFDLPDNVVFKIREDNKGRIWFFTHTGKIAYFFNGTIYSYKYNDNIAREIKSIVISDAYIDNDENILINSSVFVNYRILNTGVIEKHSYIQSASDGMERVTINVYEKNISFSQVQNIVSAKKHEFIVSLKTENGVIDYKVFIGNLPELGQYGCRTINRKDFYFYLNHNLVKLMPDGSTKVKILGGKILGLLIDKTGNMWAGLEKAGAVLLDSDLNELYNATPLNFKSVSSVAQDYEGGTWFSTLENGVYYLKNMHVGYLKLDTTSIKEVSRIYVQNNDTVLYTRQNGVYSLANFNKVRFILPLENVKIMDFFTDKKNNFFIGGKLHEAANTNFFIKEVNNKKFILFPATCEVGRHSDTDLIWQNGSYMMAIKRYNTGGQNTFSANNFKARVNYFEPGITYLDNDGQVWCGTINNLYKVNAATLSPGALEKPHAIFTRGITCMRQLYSGIYAIGIRFGGIALMKDNVIIGNITESEGLLNNSVKYLFAINDELWTATAKGISVIKFQSYAPLKYTIINIGKNAGYYNLITNQLLQYRDHILAATNNGIYFIAEPGKILNEIPKSIPFYINTVTYYKGDTSNITGISVPYNKNKVIIKYAALCFNAQDEIKYYYRFDNRDTTWQTIKSTELLLENLSPGNYNIELKAAIPNENRFSAIKKLQITVEKPWWQNNWLQLATIVLFLATVYLLYRRRVHVITKREKRNTELNSRMAELEQMALRSQMNPHFIFNCLTSIQQLIITGNKIDANEYLVKFARLIRKTLDLSAHSFITVEEETDYLREYLVLEQLRIPGQFEFSIAVDENINIYRTEIPGMMLQPIVENSIRHGIKHMENKNGKVDISLKRREGYILCSIIDNGVGRLKSGENKMSSFRENKSYGMEIVTRRLNAISFNKENVGTLEVEDLFNNDGSSAGTSVTMWLPCKTKLP